MGVVEKLTPFAMQPPIGRVITGNAAVETARLRRLSTERQAHTIPTGQMPPAVFPDPAAVRRKFSFAHDESILSKNSRLHEQQVAKYLNQLMLIGELVGTPQNPLLGYQPDNLGDWNGVQPTGVTDALNVLAARSLNGVSQAAFDAAFASLTDSIATVADDVATVASDLAAHLVDATDAHDASAISVVPSGGQTGTDAQGAIDHLQSDIDAVDAALAIEENYAKRYAFLGL